MWINWKPAEAGVERCNFLIQSPWGHSQARIKDLETTYERVDGVGIALKRLKEVAGASREE